MDRKPYRATWRTVALTGLVMAACQNFELPASGAGGSADSPSAAPSGVELAAFRAELEPLMQRRPLSVRTQARGVTAYELGDSFHSVALVKIDADGAARVECVDSVAEAEAFLTSTPRAGEQ